MNMSLEDYIEYIFAKFPQPEIIRIIFPKLPVGFAFRPTDEELVSHCLKLNPYDGIIPELVGHCLKLNPYYGIIPVIDLRKKEPQELADLLDIKISDRFFFNPIEFKYSNSNRIDRQTEKGHWKPTGKDKEIMSGTQTLGTRKTLSYHERGRTPRNTHWTIHEYQATGNDKYVLCHLINKSDENTGCHIPVPVKAVAGSGNGFPGDIPRGVGPSSLRSNLKKDYMQLDDEDLDMQDALLESMLDLHNDDFSLHTERKPGLDFLSPSDFTNSNGEKVFEDTKSSDGLYIDSDGYLTQKLSTSPICPLSGRSSNGTDTEVLQVKVIQQYSNCGVAPKGICVKLKENSDSIKAKIWAEYDSATHLPQNNNPFKANQESSWTCTGALFVNVVVGMIMSVSIIVVMMVDMIKKF